MLEIKLTIRIPDNAREARRNEEMTYTVEALDNLDLGEKIKALVRQQLDTRLYTESLPIEVVTKEFRMIWTKENRDVAGAQVDEVKKS
jgi:hypothetical protein